MYGVECLPAGKWYVGQTTNLTARVKAHSNPATAPRHMRADVKRYQPFADHFRVHTLAANITDQSTANHLELLWTTKKDSTQPKGYNSLAGNPFRAGRFPGWKGKGVFFCKPNNTVT